MRLPGKMQWLKFQHDFLCAHSVSLGPDWHKSQFSNSEQTSTFQPKCKNRSFSYSDKNILGGSFLCVQSNPPISNMAMRAQFEKNSKNQSPQGKILKSVWFKRNSWKKNQFRILRAALCPRTGDSVVNESRYNTAHTTCTCNQRPRGLPIDSRRPDSRPLISCPDCKLTLGISVAAAGETWNPKAPFTQDA